MSSYNWSLNSKNGVSKQLLAQNVGLIRVTHANGSAVKIGTEDSDIPLKAGETVFVGGQGDITIYLDGQDSNDTNGSFGAS